MQKERSSVRRLGSQCSGYDPAKLKEAWYLEVTLEHEGEGRKPVPPAPGRSIASSVRDVVGA
eukprot:2756894-Rhodomonas_salina.1